MRVFAGRLGSFVLSLLVASMVVFGLLNLLPGDVAQVILGNNADPESVARLRVELGLDRPAPLRYLDWLAGLLTGDPGRSALTGEPTLPDIASRFAVTGWLVLLGMGLAILIALPVGRFAAANRKSTSGQVVSALSQVGMAVPAFLMGIILVTIFAVQWRWLPANGYTPLTADPGQWLRRMILPVISLALVQSAVLTRYVRNAFIDVLAEDYFRTARSVGWPFRYALKRHGLRNVALQVVTVLGLQLATLFVGAIVIENVFVLPGLGSYLLSAVNNRDLPIVQSVVMILVALVLIINLLVDLAYFAIDPRLRTTEEAVET